MKPVVVLFLLLLTIHSGNLEPCAGTSDVYAEAVAVHSHSTPKANSSAGIFTQKSDELDVEGCVASCCEDAKCNAIFMFNTECFAIECVSNEACEPMLRKNPKFEHAYVAVVRPVDSSQSVVIDGEEFSALASLDDAFFSGNDKISARDRGSEVVGDVPRPCKMGLDLFCAQNEQCVSKNKLARKGFCQCVDGFEKDTSGLCNPVRIISQQMVIANLTSRDNVEKVSANTPSSVVTDVKTTTHPATDIMHLVVSAGEDKVIQLPENETSLSAFAIPKEQEGEHYKYEWTLISHPEGYLAGTMSNTNLPTLKLSGLQEGVYKFKVSVTTGEGVSESASVNVTALAPKRANKPPVAIINPVNQTVKLPTMDTVLDGSSSTDDDKIASYSWEIVTAPMGYTPQLTNTATLQLKSLIPGFYRLMLTVVDSDGASNATFANVTVIKEMDYPPTANAGGDVIIYLPQNSVNLNGNMSSDDKGIKTWEWFKGSDTDKAVDMQDTRTPYLKLSNLEVGMYTFMLKVTDTADQTSTSEVHVFVKPGNEGPFAESGPDIEITLPVNWVVLDGSKSHDDVSITQWEWKQVSGPSSAQFRLENATMSVAKATGLTKGVYVFQLTVYDAKQASSTKAVTVTVNQSKNDPPSANAGGDRTVQLPTNLIILNGSNSVDDAGIVKYEWMLDPTSLAAVEILEGSDHTALLMITGFIPGRYVFRLTVYDAEGLKDTDSASLIIKPSVHEKDEIQMMISTNINSFSEQLKITLAKKLALLLHEDGGNTVQITKITAGMGSASVALTLHVQKTTPAGDTVILSGTNVVQQLKRRLKMDSGLLDVPVISVETVICQNNCSNHGSCDQFTKHCVCEAFWMVDLFQIYFGDGESNCDWSILYVIIILFVGIIIVAGVSWGVTCLCASLRRRRTRKHRYSLLGDYTDREAVQMLPKGSTRDSSVMMSDSESDAVVFEKNKQNGNLANGMLNNGVNQSPRRVRT